MSPTHGTDGRNLARERMVLSVEERTAARLRDQVARVLTAHVSRVSFDEELEHEHDAAYAAYHRRVMIAATAQEEYRVAIYQDDVPSLVLRRKYEILLGHQLRVTSRGVWLERFDMALEHLRAGGRIPVANLWWMPHLWKEAP